MRLNILLCDRFQGLLPYYIPSYEWMFIRLFENNCSAFSYKIYDVLDGVFPSEINTSDVYLITGCNLSAYDNVEWIVRLRRWVVRADGLKAKIVGVCFGHQLIAEALGGKVERSPKGWGTGVRCSSLVGEEALSRFPTGQIRLMYNHHDQVVALPPDAVLFASSEFCSVDGFYIGNHIITFQGHPEYIPEYAVHLIMDCADDEPKEVRETALRSIGAMRHDGDAVARWIAERYDRWDVAKEVM